MKLVHTALRFHTPKQEAVARNVSKNMPWRANPFWGFSVAIPLINRLLNKLKGPTSDCAFDEVVCESASVKARDWLLRFPLKNADWGVPCYMLCGSLKGVLSDEEFSSYKGKGFPHAMVLRSKKKAPKGPCAYYGVAYDLYNTALNRDVPLSGLWMRVYADNFFVSPEACYNSRDYNATHFIGVVKGTCFGSRLLPSDWKDMREIVSSDVFQKGEYTNRWSPVAKLLFSYCKSNRAVAFMSTFHKDTDTGSLNR